MCCCHDREVGPFLFLVCPCIIESSAHLPPRPFFPSPTTPFISHTALHVGSAPSSAQAGHSHGPHEGRMRPARHTHAEIPDSCHLEEEGEEGKEDGLVLTCNSGI